MKNTALLIVDLQNDFLPGGALGVKGGDEIIPLINAMQIQFDRIFASKDWHPKNHVSFASTHQKEPYTTLEVEDEIQELWPEHCVQKTFGAEFPNNLNISKIEKVFFKGSDPFIDSYSAFYDNAHKRSTGLGEYLKKEKINELTVVGLTTEYCIKYTALDALRLGITPTVIESAVRGVEINESDSAKALEQMRKAGVLIKH